MIKALEAFNDLIYNYEHLEKEQFNKDCKIVINELKAFEIIKRTAMKLISLEDDTTICRKGRYAIYDNELYQSIDITKEEYELLKEVLEND